MQQDLDRRTHNHLAAWLNFRTTPKQTFLTGALGDIYKPTLSWLFFYYRTNLNRLTCGMTLTLSWLTWSTYSEQTQLQCCAKHELTLFKYKSTLKADLYKFTCIWFCILFPANLLSIPPKFTGCLCWIKEYVRVFVHICVCVPACDIYIYLHRSMLCSCNLFSVWIVYNYAVTIYRLLPVSTDIFTFLFLSH